jgi:hypothetical protein
MKSMDRVSRGNGFKGVLAYNLGVGKGEVVGGTLSCDSVQEMALEFRSVASARPDIKKPVWHQSLRLPKGERIDVAKFVAIAHEYMREMGFDAEKHQYALIHDDMASGQHIHIVANRVATDGSVYLGKNENLISSRLCGELEVKFDLQRTVQADKKTSNRSKARKNELKMADRTGVLPPRQFIQNAIDAVLKGVRSLDWLSFEGGLFEKGVNAVRTENSRGLVGYSFEHEGVAFKGSQLGKAYTKNGLIQRGLEEFDSFTSNNEISQEDIAHVKGAGATAPKPSVRTERSGLEL